MKLKFAALLGMLAFLTLAHADVIFTDTEFAHSDWELIVYKTANGGTASAGQIATGGNPDAYRKITNVVNSAASGTRSTVIGFHRRQGADYDPSTQGSIIEIDYSEDSIFFGPSDDGQATGPALRQAGELYVLSPLRLVNYSSWRPFTASGLRPIDFIRVNTNDLRDYRDFDSHPNFSSTAPSIEFGFVRANSTGLGGGGSTQRGGIDNWTLAVRNGVYVTIRLSEVEVCWNSLTNWCYEVQYRPAFNPAAPWITLTNCISGNGTTNCVYDKIPLGQPQRFYQVVGTNGVPTNCVEKP